MRLNKLVLTGLTTLGLASAVLANGRNPGSLLLFPEFDSRPGTLTLVTVTNTNGDTTPTGAGGTFAGTIDVEFDYIGKRGPGNQLLDCLESNRIQRLTPNDTFSALVSAHDPNQEQGYLYVFARDINTGAAKVFNFLIGNEMTLMSIAMVDYSMNPVSFKGIGNGQITDLDGDGNRDLDGTEYEAVPDYVMIPRFLGQVPLVYDSDLILIGLTGGTAFTTIVGFAIYNDNEEAFSAQYTFRCWDRVPLININGVFSQSFLSLTNHAPNEIYGVLPPGSHTAGWFKVFGQTAFSTAEQIHDPAIYAVLIEKFGTHGAADLPFESTATQTNGSLLPHGIFGDGDPIPVNGDNQ
jgi:hypothetical protein